ncbi:transmembrane protein 180 [Cebus imitator]|uniref:transmembrane protein 180 n=1 Tax=Cebus imitator TaxID=2715852 RepID=UPI00189C1010|nr:transmembrane protein 180 [Cebus imitator]
MGLGWPQAWLLGLPTAVVYGSLALFTTILHNVFLLYYVDTFVSVYKINKAAFWVGETVFLVWNSLNDPLFGWLSDRQFLSSQPRSGARLSSRAVVLARVRALGWHGPLLALAFLAFWVPWAPAGLQFLLCLCLYDGFLTLVDLHHHALLADLALSAHDRTHLNFYCSLFSAAGSLSVFASYAFWNKEDFSSFRAFCVTLAVSSGLGFLGATQLLRWRVEAARRDPGCSGLTVDSGLCGEELLVGSEEVDGITLGQYLRQLAHHRNFLWFVSMDLVQVFHCHFNSNFFPLFLEHLLSDHISLSTGSILLGKCGPQVLHAGWKDRGLHPRNPSPAVGMATSPAGTLVAEGREESVVGVAPPSPQLFPPGRGGQSFAPRLGGQWADHGFLYSFVLGHDLFQQSLITPVGSAHPWPEPPAPAPARAPTLRQGCFYLLVLVPITCALLQLFTWSQFTLHGRRLHMVKAQRQNLSQAQTQDVKMV